MASFVGQGFTLPQPFAWLDRLEGLLMRELAPSWRKFRTTLRMTIVATSGAALVTICHVNSELGVYIVWLLVGAGPMMSMRKALEVLAAEAVVLATSVVMARALAETPWLMLPFLFAIIALSTYLGTAWKLGATLLLMEVVSLNIFYGVAFAPGEIGWSAAGTFGGSAVAFGTIVLFDNWLWPAPSEVTLLESVAASLTRARSRLLAAAEFYFDPRAPRPALPPPTSDLPGHLGFLENVRAEGVSAHRYAILLALVTRIARIYLEVDRLIVAAREDVPREIRAMMRAQVQNAVDAIAEVLDEIARDLPTHIAVGVDEPPPASRVRARAAMELLNARIVQSRPSYIGRVGEAEAANFASFTDSLTELTRHIERLLDQPPPPAVSRAASSLTGNRDPAMVRYSLKVGACAVAGYLVGLFSQRPELSTIMTTVLITALPTYGAALRKMNLRIIGACIGGVVTLLTIIVVSPNFETLPAYLLALFIVFFVSAYSSVTSGRVSYAGKQIGTTFALVFAGLSPSLDVYGPLWRIWAILVGTVVVAIITFIMWPEYAGDSLMPRLRAVIRGALALAPGGAASKTENEIQQANAETMKVLAEMLQIADDAQIEGRTAAVDHEAILQAAGTLRRIANRLASVGTGRIITPAPSLDATTEYAREAFFVAISRDLRSWFDFFSSDQCLSALAARGVALTLSSDQLSEPLAQFGSRLEEREFGRIASWTLEQRRTILAELQSMRRLEYLVSQLNRWLAKIPGPAQNLANLLARSHPRAEALPP